jgi:hypothetical protein
MSGVHFPSQADVPHASDDAPTPSAAVAATVNVAVMTLRKILVLMEPWPSVERRPWLGSGTCAYHARYSGHLLAASGVFSSICWVIFLLALRLVL